MRPNISQLRLLIAERDSLFSDLNAARYMSRDKAMSLVKEKRMSGGMSGGTSRAMSGGFSGDKIDLPCMLAALQTSMEDGPRWEGFINRWLEEFESAPKEDNQEQVRDLPINLASISASTPASPAIFSKCLTLLLEPFFIFPKAQEKTPPSLEAALKNLSHATQLFKKVFDALNFKTISRSEAMKAITNSLSVLQEIKFRELPPEKSLNTSKKVALLEKIIDAAAASAYGITGNEKKIIEEELAVLIDLDLEIIEALLTTAQGKPKEENGSFTFEGIAENIDARTAAIFLVILSKFSAEEAKACFAEKVFFNSASCKECSQKAETEGNASKAQLIPQLANLYRLHLPLLLNLRRPNIYNTDENIRASYLAICMLLADIDKAEVASTNSNRTGIDSEEQKLLSRITTQICGIAKLSSDKNLTQRVGSALKENLPNLIKTIPQEFHPKLLFDATYLAQINGVVSSEVKFIIDMNASTSISSPNKQKAIVRTASTLGKNFSEKTTLESFLKRLAKLDFKFFDLTRLTCKQRHHLRTLFAFYFNPGENEEPASEEDLQAWREYEKNLQNEDNFIIEYYALKWIIKIFNCDSDTQGEGEVLKNQLESLWQRIISDIPAANSLLSLHETCSAILMKALVEAGRLEE